MKKDNRWFESQEDLMKSSDGILFAFTREIGKSNINKIIDFGRKQGYKIEPVLTTQQVLQVYFAEANWTWSNKLTKPPTKTHKYVLLENKGLLSRQHVLVTIEDKRLSSVEPNNSLMGPKFMGR